MNDARKVALQCAALVYSGGTRAGAAESTLYAADKFYEWLTENAGMEEE